MKIGKWKFRFESLWFKNELEWLHHWEFRFVGLAIIVNDLGGRIAALNFVVKWEKMFK